MRWPWTALVVVTTFASSETALFALQGRDNPPNSALMISLLTSITWSWWIHADRKRCQAGLPFEFDAFVFFAWPFLVPYYLVRTRRARAAAPSVLLWTLYALPFAVAMLGAISSVR